MKYEFSHSWSFNQMLLVSVFAHLLLMTIIMFLPKTKMPPPVEAAVWNIELINTPAGSIEDTRPQRRPEKIRPQITDKKGSKQEEQLAALTKPVPAKPDILPRKVQKPQKKVDIEKKAAVPKPAPVIRPVPVKKPAPPKKRVETKVAAAVPKPVIPKPKPLEPVVSKPETSLKMPPIPEIVIREKLPDVPKIALSTPVISHSKPQPKALPKLRKRAVRSESRVVRELDLDLDAELIFW